MNLINPYRFGGGAFPDDPIAEYLFATNADDTSGNGYNGTISGGTVSGGLLTQTANTDHVRVGDYDAFSFTDGAGSDEAFSFSAWVRPTTATGSVQNIIGRIDSSTSVEWGSFFNPSGLATFVLYKNNASFGTYILGQAGTAYTQNDWLHVVGTYDGGEASSGINVYLDGVNETSTQSGAGSYTGMSNTPANLEIGNRGNGNFGLIGDMDNVRVYDRELTTDEVTELYNEGHS